MPRAKPVRPPSVLPVNVVVMPLFCSSSSICRLCHATPRHAPAMSCHAQHATRYKARHATTPCHHHTHTTPKRCHAIAHQPPRHMPRRKQHHTSSRHNAIPLAPPPGNTGFSFRKEKEKGIILYRNPEVREVGKGLKVVCCLYRD